MENMYYINYKISNEFLIINMDQSLNNNDSKIIFINRKTEKKTDVKFIEERIENGKYEITLNLNEISEFMNNESLQYLDAFIYHKKQYFRLESYSNVVSKTENRFSKNIYKINSNFILVPYTTKYNNLSIQCGHPSLLFEKYVHFQKSSNSINATLLENRSLKIDSNIKNINNVFIGKQIKGQWTFLDLEIKRDFESGCLITSSIKDLATQNIFLMIKNRNVIVTKKITVNLNYKNKYKKDVFETHDKVTINSTIEILDLHIENEFLQIRLNEIDSTNYEKLHLIAKNRKTDEIFYIKNYNIINNSSNQIVLKINHFELLKLNNNTSRWNVFLMLEAEDYVEFCRLCYAKCKPKKQHERYLTYNSLDNNKILSFYLTVNYKLSMVITNKFKLTDDMLNYKIELLNIKKKKDNIFGKINLSIKEIKDYEVTSFLLVYRNNTETIQHEFLVKEIQNNKGNKNLIFKITNIKDLQLKQYYWDSYIKLDIRGKDYYIRISNPSDLIKNKLKNKETFARIKMNKHFFYPYITNNNKLAFSFRIKEKYETKLHTLKSLLAQKIYRWFSSYFDSKKIWLVFEKESGTAQDNGYYFFRYVYENHPDVNIYYVLNKNSEDKKKMLSMKNRVIDLMSFKYMLYTLASTLLIGSETRMHLYNIRQQNGILSNAIKKKQFVFLQHGVLGFKRVEKILKKGSLSAVDYFVTSSDFEANIVKEYFGYDRNEIFVTGLSRWDALKNKSQITQEKFIFFMPTWRSWLDGCSDEEFLESDYFKKYMNLFNSPELEELLIKSNTIMKFCIHPKFKDYINYFQIKNKNIEIYKFNDLPINEMIKESSLLITDYSSVSWDFYYLKKPVIFYQFDYDQYMERQGSYMDMKEEMFGDRVILENELIKKIGGYIYNSFQEKEIFADKRAKYFKFHDNKNAERTFNEIRNKYLTH